MRPYIICHMLSSVDGKIGGAALDAFTGDGEYEATGAKLNGDAWICGRTTMQQHFAEDEPFVSGSNTPAGPRPVFVARRAKSYAISVDTLGKLRWSGGDLDGEHLICVVSEQVPEDYLAMLREKGPFLNEELVGEALAPFRDQVVIATEFGFDLNPNFDPRGMKGAPGPEQPARAYQAGRRGLAQAAQGRCHRLALSAPG